VKKMKIFLKIAAATAILVAAVVLLVAFIPVLMS